MATWERETRGSRSIPAEQQRPFPLLHLALANGLVFLFVASVSWGLKIQSEVVQTASITALSHPASVKSAVPVQATKPLYTAAKAQPTLRTSQVVSRRPPQVTARFVVSFGGFPRREIAETRARLVRSKGYFATVTRVGPSYHVVSHPYPDRHVAEYWSKVFHQIGLPGNVTALGETRLSQAIEGWITSSETLGPA